MRNKILLIALVALVVAGCGTKQHDFHEFTDEAPLARMAPEVHPSQQSNNQVSKAVDVPFDNQMLIKTAYLGIQVAEYQKARYQIDSIAKLYKAWVSAESMYNYDYRIANDMTIRVPTETLSSLIDGILSIANKVDFQRIETIDVTEEYIDVKSRLNNQRAVEKTFVALLRRTDSIDDILKIQTKLAEVRSQIESFEGRLKYLNNKVNYSTLNLNFYQKIDFKYVPEPIESFWERLKKSLHSGWKGFVLFLLFLIRLWTLWLIAVFIWFIIKRYRTRKVSKEALKKKKKIRVKKKGLPKQASTDKPIDKSQE